MAERVGHLHSGCVNPALGSFYIAPSSHTKKCTHGEGHTQHGEKWLIKKKKRLSSSRTSSSTTHAWCPLSLQPVFFFWRKHLSPKELAGRKRNVVKQNYVLVCENRDRAEKCVPRSAQGYFVKENLGTHRDLSISSFSARVTFDDFMVFSETSFE